MYEVVVYSYLYIQKVISPNSAKVFHSRSMWWDPISAAEQSLAASLHVSSYFLHISIAMR